MKVYELKELLQDVSDRIEVWISSDAEGNNFKPVDEVILQEVAEDDGDEIIVNSDFESNNLGVGDQVLMIWPV